MSTPVDNTQLMALVQDLEVKEQALADASDSNDQAQAAAQQAVSAASATLAAKTSAHDDLSASVQALVDFVKTLAS